MAALTPGSLRTNVFLTHSPRLFRPFLPNSWSLLCRPSSSTAWVITPPESPAPISAVRIIILDLLLELFPSILVAAPKKKVSHSRKSMRSANKGLQNKTNISHCSACGKVKLSHHLCPDCYSQISRRWKAEARGEDPWATPGGGNKGAGEEGPKESAASA